MTATPLAGPRRPRRFAVGTYTRPEPHVAGHAPGLALGRFAPLEGRCELVSWLEGVVNPAFLLPHPDGLGLTVCCEVGAALDDPEASLLEVRLTRADTLELRAQHLCGGVQPCHLSHDPSGRWLLCTNYGNGRLTVFPISSDGRLGPISSATSYTGAGSHPEQDGPRPHSAVVSPAGRHVLVPAKGADAVFVHDFDPRDGRLGAAAPRAVEFPAGSGPRHLEFHPSGRWCSLVHELSGRMTVCSWDDHLGLHEVHTVSIESPAERGPSCAADVHYSPDGRHVLASERAGHTLSSFAVDPEDGRPRLVCRVSSGGRTPRNFGFDPSGRFVLITNQDSDSLEVMRFDALTGRLSRTSLRTAIPSPACVRFLDS